MSGRHIVDGDVVVLDPGLSPYSGDVVAVLIENQSTLMAYVSWPREPLLRDENPECHREVPASEAVIQGVMVALVRRRK